MVAPPEEKVRKRPVSASQSRYLAAVATLFGRWVPPLHGVEDAERNQVAVGGGVGHVPSGGEDCCGKGASHPTQIVGALWHEKRDGYAFPIGVRRR